MRTPALAVLTLAALGLTVAGCTDNPPTSATPSTPGGTGTAAAPAGQVDQCVVGNWRSAGANAHARGEGASATLTGGAGVAVTITEAGTVTIDFSGMQPTDFSVQVAGAQARGHFVYSGRATGTIRTGESATPDPSAVTPSAVTASATAGAGTSAGSWEPVPPIDWGDVRVTVDLTEPVAARPFDGVRIGEVLGGGVDQTGDVVDVNPLFGRGGYECGGDMLRITPDEGGIGWELTRV